MGFSPADCEALLSLAKGLSYQIGIKYGYCHINMPFLISSHMRIILNSKYKKANWLP